MVACPRYRFRGGGVGSPGSGPDGCRHGHWPEGTPSRRNFLPGVMVVASAADSVAGSALFRARQTRYYAIGMDFAELEAGSGWWAGNAPDGQPVRRPRSAERVGGPDPLVFTRTVWPPHTLCENP